MIHVFLDHFSFVRSGAFLPITQNFHFKTKENTNSHLSHSLWALSLIQIRSVWFPKSSPWFSNFIKFFEKWVDSFLSFISYFLIGLGLCENSFNFFLILSPRSSLVWTPIMLRKRRHIVKWEGAGWVICEGLVDLS